MTPEEIEAFRKSVNGEYCGPSRRVKGSRFTSDPKVYRQWLKDEARRQRERFKEKEKDGIRREAQGSPADPDQES